MRTEPPPPKTPQNGHHQSVHYTTEDFTQMSFFLQMKCENKFAFDYD